MTDKHLKQDLSIVREGENNITEGAPRTDEDKSKLKALVAQEMETSDGITKGSVQRLALIPSQIACDIEHIKGFPDRTTSDGSPGLSGVSSPGGGDSDAGRACYGLCDEPITDWV